MDGRGLPAPKSDDSLVPLSIGTLWHTTATTPALQPPLSLFLLTASWTDERREVTEGGSEGSPSRQQAPTPSVLCCRSVPYFNKVLPRRFKRGWDWIHSLAFLLALQKAPVLTPLRKLCSLSSGSQSRVSRLPTTEEPPPPTKAGRRPRFITHSSHNRSTLKLTYSLGQSSECVRDTIRAQYLNSTLV